MNLQSIYEDERKHLKISYILLSILLLLRLVLLAVIGPLLKSTWIDTSYEVGTYLFTAILIFWERKRLLDFNIDIIAVMFFLTLKPIETILLIYLNNKSLLLPYKPLGVIIWIISIGLTISLIIGKYRPDQITRKKLLWLFLAFIIGIIIAILLGFPMSYQLEKSQFYSTFKTFITSGFMNNINILYQAGFAGISEEPLFRGFLWGYLLKLRWKNIWILLFQTGLFMLAHIYYLTKHPISFFIIVPFSALVFGLIVWKSKTISTSIIAHGTINGMGREIGQFIRNIRIG